MQRNTLFLIIGVAAVIVLAGVIGYKMMQGNSSKLPSVYENDPATMIEQEGITVDEDGVMKKDGVTVSIITNPTEIVTPNTDAPVPDSVSADEIDSIMRGENPDTINSDLSDIQ